MTNLMTFARTAALAGVVSGCVALSAPAFAADSDAPPRGTVSVTGTDFTSPHAVAQLKGRMRRVAMDICVQNSGGSMTLDELHCYRTAIKDGLAQIASRQQQAMAERPLQVAVADPAH